MTEAYDREGQYRGTSLRGVSPWGLDIDGACAFLGSQARELECGLTHGDDPDTCQRVVQTHEQSHDAWLRLLACIDDADLCGQLAGLYGFHGRIVESIQRSGTGRFSAAGVDDVRRILGDRLAACTAAAITSLHAATGETADLVVSLPN